MIATPKEAGPSRGTRENMRGVYPLPASHWGPMIQNPQGLAYTLSLARHNVVPAGRRSGKTYRLKRKVVRKAIQFGYERPDIDDGFFIFGAPTREQVKAIYWKDLKRMIPRELILGKPNETSLSVTLITGVEIACVGMDRAERHEGRPIDGGGLDEYGNMKPDVWTDHIRPALSTRGREGWMDFIGVPEGRNHYFELYQDATKDGWDEWAAFTWKSSEILSPKEIESARRTLDPLTFEQEYEASFVTFAGRAYYCFSESRNVRRDLPYDKQKPLILCFDFNSSPGTASVLQEHIIDGQQRTCVIGEIWIKQNSNTPMVCRRLIEDWGSHEGEVHGYGDKTGGQKKSSGVAGSDWDLVEAAMHGHFGDRWSRMIRPGANGPERARVNAVNSRCQTIDGTVSLLVDGARAPRTVLDFEGVRSKEDGSIDKKDLNLTHLTDGIGYYVVHEWPCQFGDGSTSVQLHY